MDYKNYSVLMSVYYKEKPENLQMSINSILDQTLKPEEFLIVKDGPLTNELNEVLEKYKFKYPKVFNIISLKENVGLGPALAVGIELCRNELIARMDSDDYSCPTRCEKEISIFNQDNDMEVVGSYEVEFDQFLDNIISVHKVPETTNEIYEYMKRRCALLHPTVMYKKSSVLRCGNYNNVRLYEDYDMFMRLVIKNKAKCYNIQEGLYYIRVNDEFYKRRGGMSYMKTVVNFKKQQYEKNYMSLSDYIVSAGTQAIVCIMPNILRKWFYVKFLRR